VDNRTGAFWVQVDLKTMKLVQHGTLADPKADILFPWTFQEATTNETLPPETNADRYGTHWVAWRVGGR
jgi:hypothetical protein